MKLSNEVDGAAMATKDDEAKTSQWTTAKIIESATNQGNALRIFFNYML